MKPNITPEKSEKKIAIITMDIEASHLSTGEGIYRFLNILNKLDIKATFFITYSAAEHFPNIIKYLVKGGHEIASHGYTHLNNLKNIKKFLSYSQQEIEKEIKLSKNFLKKFNVEPQGIRLPAFQCNEKILNIVSKYFKYDSSLLLNYFGKLPKFYKHLDKNLIEIPISRIKYLNLRTGTPIFLKPGGKFLVKLIQIFGLGTPLTLYCHSFDLNKIDLEKLPVKGWKKWWYYKHCGPDADIFFNILFKYLKRKNYNFLTCEEYIRDYIEK